MKTHKIIISTLALAMGAALAGSVSGTVAWFQYSTRAQATYIGESVHCSEALEVSADSGSTWKTELSKVSPASNTGDKLEPITTGALNNNVALPTIGGTGADKDDPKFYKNPVYQFADPAVWGLADAHNYVQFTLNFRVRDIDGAANNPTLLSGHNLYLTNLEIVSLADSAGSATTDAHDLYKAIRVHISASGYNALFAAGDSSNDVTTVTHGKLDLNNDGEYDQTVGYDWTANRSEIDYGNPTNAAIADPDTIVQNAYSAGKSANFADDTNPANVVNTTAAPGKIGAIDKTNGLSITVTIWIEGWTELDVAPAGNKDKAQSGTDSSPVWDPATYAGKNFGVGLRFATELHNGSDAEHA